MITCRHLGCGRNLPVWLLGLGLVLALGCGDIPGDADDTGSIVKVVLTPTYLGDDTNQVDILQDLCTSGGEGETTWEEFSDHFARAGFTNQSLPNTSEQTASSVLIHSYTISYEPVSPSGAPDLDPYRDVPLSETAIVPPCAAGTLDCPATEYTGLKFVDFAKKLEYLAKGGGSLPQSSYNIRYTFRGENIFGETFTFAGGTNFTMANYDYCQ